MVRNRARKTARRRRTDEEILGQLDTELQAVVDAAVAKINLLLRREEARAQ